ncbi:Cell differentiation protein rcd1 [Tieghemostelium lacteum]|uniref:Cell differentiation protein rcd1 n=1 Tax=Tieghemostelium lacteum TaxID=361077 RepID=A0A152A1Y5_TIELA|nr:Cell differentiation protein rcd1 [Tieghemostelium lacteum]|eukprot:KYR00081.1 Cell differentiation protein rcd1 [Tieghemostelium lacteum]
MLFGFRGLMGTNSSKNKDQTEYSKFNIPILISINILNLIINQEELVSDSNDLTLLCRFVTRMSLVCKDWRTNLIPRLQLFNPLLIDKSVQHINYLLDLGIHIPVSLDVDNINNSSRYKGKIVHVHMNLPTTYKYPLYQFLQNNRQIRSLSLSLLNTFTSIRTIKVVIQQDNYNNFHGDNNITVQSFKEFIENIDDTTLLNLNHLKIDGELEKLGLNSVFNHLNSLQKPLPDSVLLNLTTLTISNIHSTTEETYSSSLCKLTTLTTLTLNRFPSNVIIDIIQNCPSIRNLSVTNYIINIEPRNNSLKPLLEALIPNTNIENFQMTNQANIFSLFKPNQRNNSAPFSTLIQLLNTNHTLKILNIPHSQFRIKKSNETPKEEDNNNNNNNNNEVEDGVLVESKIQNSTLTHLMLGEVNKKNQITNELVKMWVDISALVKTDFDWTLVEGSTKMLIDHFPHLQYLKVSNSTGRVAQQDLLKLNMPMLVDMSLTTFKDLHKTLQFNRTLTSLTLKDVIGQFNIVKFLKSNHPTIIHLYVISGQISWTKFSNALSQNTYLRTLTFLDRFINLDFENKKEKPIILLISGLTSIFTINSSLVTFHLPALIKCSKKFRKDYKRYMKPLKEALLQNNVIHSLSFTGDYYDDFPPLFKKELQKVFNTKLIKLKFV